MQSPPEDWVQLAAGQAGSVLLRTARPDPENQWSFLFRDAVAILSASHLDAIPVLFSSIEKALRDGYYVAGFLSYEAGYHFEPAAIRSGDILPLPANLPLAWFGVFRQPLVRNESAQRPFDSRPRLALAEEPPPSFIALSKDAYCDQLQTIRQRIEAGDFYQANFTINIAQPCSLDAANLFEQIIESQPVAFGALIRAGSTHILSASPELFFRKQGQRITVRPMKGTARRGRDGDEDARIAAELAADEKNRAENLMIVDLMRNDLGRICKTGTVRTTDLFSIERYPELLQMTSTVRGELKPETRFYEIFRSLFPCGSITGAPKVQTMKTIRELEGEPRGIACGAIGYFTPVRDAVFSVAIRTLTLQDGTAKLRVGSGITYESDPEAEYAECLLKSRFFTRPAPRFDLIETIGWAGDFLLLHLHLERLKHSAQYFDFRFDEQKTREQLAQTAAAFPPGSRQRVRLLLARSGDLSIASTRLGQSRSPALLFIASARVDASDAYLRHKTTHRPVLNHALTQAQAAGCDDALILNTQGLVTECAMHNVMIAKEGRWITPPLDCGLLPGTYRQHLLAVHPEIEQAAISIDDLLSADKVVIFNSVRGLRPGRIYNRPVV